MSGMSGKFLSRRFHVLVQLLDAFLVHASNTEANVVQRQECLLVQLVLGSPAMQFPGDKTFLHHLDALDAIHVYR